jgi:hypothetical protein
MSNETLDLDAIEARANAAMAGPWHWDAHRVPTIAEFIAAAREDVPALVAEVRSLRAARDRAVAALQRVEALAEKWRYKGEFGWGAWQEGHGPDQEGYVLDSAASDIRAAIKGEDE